MNRSLQPKRGMGSDISHHGKDNCIVNEIFIDQSMHQEIVEHQKNKNMNNPFITHEFQSETVKKPQWHSPFVGNPITIFRDLNPTVILDSFPRSEHAHQCEGTSLSPGVLGLHKNLMFSRLSRVSVFDLTISLSFLSVANSGTSVI